jgi:DNA-binding CsgD family transcriptional regulator
MPAHPNPARAARLWGRRAECGALDQLIEAVRAGESRALVLQGEPGVGKTALLDHLAARSSGCRLLRTAGVQSEMELAFAGLHQLCASMLGHLDRLPPPQQEALCTAFGLSAGPPPDRFLVGLAVLGLLSEVAGERPLVCIVDDEQWLDHASAQALGFVARRLVAESVALVFAARVPGDDVAGLPQLVVEGLGAGDARTLLASVLTGPLDAQVRDRIIAETRGNPLALLELPRGLTSAELSGGFGATGALPLPGRIQESFRRQLNELPDVTRKLLLLAAADPVGDPSLVWRAAGRLGIGVEAVAPAVEAGLAEFGEQVWFRHPLVRSTVYQAASLHDRQAAHGVLAEVTDPQSDPDRRAWHRAQAALGPDTQIAAELERSAGRAQARGGLAAAAAFLERSAALTLDPAQRTRRALAAAQAKCRAGALDAALGLLVTVEAGPLTELQRAQVDLLRGQVAFASRRSSDAPPLLLRAARRLEPLDTELARATYLESLFAAVVAGRLTPGGGVLEAAQAARAAPAPAGAASVGDLLLDGLVLLITDGYPAGAPLLRQALDLFRREDGATTGGLRWLWLACHAAILVWDHDAWNMLSARQVELARGTGALAVLPIGLNSLAAAQARAGEFRAATVLTAEAELVTEAIGSQLPPYAALLQAAYRGQEAEAAALIDAMLAEAVPRGEGMALAAVEWATAVLANGLGRYEDALTAAEQASGDSPALRFTNWALVELIEAAARLGTPGRAAGALEQLSTVARACGTDWALGVQARSRALLSEDADAEPLYAEAIERLGRAGLPPEVARARLVYGEWLRRQGRRTDAREQLRSASEMFETMGLAAFAGRARHELQATGMTARRRAAAAAAAPATGPAGPSAADGEPLTAQEAQVARLARDGLSNPEIGTRLFISARTVQYHLSKVFTKLGITSRSQLAQVLPQDSSPS